jgi:hypothetical protein
VIQIDVHSAGENPTNTSHAFHAQSAYGLRPYVSHTVHLKQHFIQSSTDLNRSTAPEKKGSWHNQQHAGHLILRSIPSFSPTTVNGAVEQSQASVDNRLLGLPGPYHRHAIDTFNICLRWSIHRSLTNTGGVYNLGGVGLPRTHSPTFPTSCLHFPLRASSGLHFNQVLTTKSKCWVSGPYGYHVVFQPLSHLP